MKSTILQILEMLLLISAIIAYYQNQHDLALLMAVFAIYMRIDRHDNSDGLPHKINVVSIPKPSDNDE